MIQSWNNKLALNVLFWVIILNAFLTLFSTASQLYLSYQRQNNALHEVSDQVEHGFGRSLSTAIWSFDTTQIEQIMDGIHARSDIASLTLVLEGGAKIQRFANDPDEDLEFKQIVLTHIGTGSGGSELGVLELGLTRAHIWQDIYAQMVVVFLSNLAKTSLACVALLFIFRHLVSRHLRHIADYVSQSDWLIEGAGIALDRGASTNGDDLNAIEAALNDSRSRLQDALGDNSVSSEQMAAVLGATVNGIIGLDREGVVDVINPAARHMLGGQSEPTPFAWPSEIKFLDGRDLRPLDASSDPVHRALAGQKLTGELHLMTKGEEFEHRYVRVSSSSIQDQRSDLKCVVVLDDVSLLEKNRQQVERKGRLDALGQLTGGIAHDFNNLLATILYALQLTKADDLSARSTRVLNTALGAVERGRALTGRLLAFARRQPGFASSRSVSEAFSEFEALARPAIEETLVVSTISPERELLIYCDHGQLDNALLNLVLNARDAIMRSGQGSKIIIKARAIDEIDGDLALRRENLRDYLEDGLLEDQSSEFEDTETYAYRYVEISVTDNGPGMSDEIKKRAIDPFFTTKDTNSGTGLGLSMVYGFIQQSDGDLRIYSESGVGTTIRMILPRGTKENTREEPHERLPLRKGNGQTILVAEDEDSLLVVLEELLIELGFKFVSAHSGSEALAILEGPQHIDLLLTDIVMPGGLGGFELAKRARSLRPDLYIVYMSGYTGFTEQEMGDVIAPMIQKPCPPAELATVLAKVLPSQNL